MPTTPPARHSTVYVEADRTERDAAGYGLFDRGEFLRVSGISGRKHDSSVQ